MVITYRARMIRIACVIAFLACMNFSYIPVANAQSYCSQLRVQKYEVNADKLRILGRYPGTSATLFACAATAANQPRDSQASSFLGCAFVVCLVIGVDVCANLAGEIIRVAADEAAVDRALRRYGC